MTEEYAQKVMELGNNPLNWGELEQPHGIGQAESRCGDWVRMTMCLDASGRIAEARFLAHGCLSALASSSVLTELARGKTPQEASAITSEEVIAYLGGLPEHKTHCSQLSYSAYQQALQALSERQPVEDAA